MRTTLLALALCTACYSPGYRDCEVTCVNSQACPAGYSCESGYCVASMGTTCGGSGSDSGMPDTGDAPSARWGTATPVQFPTGTPMGVDDDPTLTDNMLLLYVKRIVGANIDIYGAQRPMPLAVFTSPSMVDLSTSALTEASPELSKEGLTLYFATDRTGGMGGLDIWTSNRPTLTALWGTPINVTVLNSSANDEGPAISRDSLTLVFNSRRSGIGDLYISNRMMVSQNLSTPMAMTALNDPNAADEGPFLSTDKLTIYFNSNRNGNHDLFQATRASVMDGFDPPTAITELNTAGNETDPWVSPDGKHIFFMRVVGTTLTLMEATR
ncbi:MAG TPA: hypothetical protein VIV11_03970 [Kofleriaceae bacterium]